MRRVFKHYLLYFLSALVISVCNSQDISPPSVSITSPASGSPVAGTTSINISATDDAGILKVRVYAREQNSTNKGNLIGSSSTYPYTISWYTGNVPNNSNVEIYAEAQDTSGNLATSDPVQVKPSNPGLPILSYVSTFTLPPNSTVSTQTVHSVANVLPENTPFQDVHPPLIQLQSSSTHSSQNQATSSNNQQYAVEWGWNAYSGALGYGIYLSTQDAIGTYNLQLKQAASTLGVQKYSKFLTDVTKDTVVNGVITAFTSSGESGFSNTDKASFLLDQPTTVTPEDGQTINTGKPTLTWNALNGADGYLYYLYDRNPWDQNAKLLWGNYPQSISGLGASYPTDKTLSAGTYYWWVAAVKFDNNGQADAFSFSNPKKLIVP